MRMRSGRIRQKLLRNLSTCAVLFKQLSPAHKARKIRSSDECWLIRYRQYAWWAGSAVVAAPHGLPVSHRHPRSTRCRFDMRNEVRTVIIAGLRHVRVVPRPLRRVFASVADRRAGAPRSDPRVGFGRWCDGGRRICSKTCTHPCNSPP